MRLPVSAPLVLVVEDEQAIAHTLMDYLERSGFRCEHVEDGAEVATRVRTLQPSLVLLDLMLPGRDGIDVCKELRAFTEIPIIMVTARVEEIDRLLGLELGADDYVCKPFSPREVVARVKTVLRRASRPVAVAVGDGERLVIDAERQIAAIGGRALELTRTEFRLLQALAARPGRIYSRAQIVAIVYPHGQDVDDRTVDSHVRNLRRKLREASPGERLIESVYGVGYRLEL